MFSIKILESNSNLKKQIAEAVKDEIAQFYIERVNFSVPIVRQRFLNFCHGSDVFDRIISGKIAGELGLPYNLGRNYLYSVFQNFSEKLNIEYLKGKNGVIRIYLKDGWQEELLSSYPIIISETAKSEIRWLDWLLKEGTKTIIKEYRFLSVGAGRSQEGIMVKGGTWGITDSDIAGTENDNFLTRLFDSFTKDFDSIFMDIFDV